MTKQDERFISHIRKEIRAMRKDRRATGGPSNLTLLCRASQHYAFRGLMETDEFHFLCHVMRLQYGKEFIR